MRALPEVSAPLTAGLAVVVLLGAGLSVGMMIATATLVAAVAAEASAGPTSATGTHLAGALATVVALLALTQVAGQLQQVLTMKLGRELEAGIRVRAMRAALSPAGIRHLEDPALIDLVSRARGAAMAQYTPALALWGLVDLVAGRLQAVAAAALIAVYFHWWLAVGLFVLLQVGRTRSRQLTTDRVQAGIASSTTGLRRSGYFLDLALSAGAAKEARIFGLAEWIVSSFSGLWHAAMADIWVARRRSTAAAGPWLLGCVLPAVLGSVALLGWAAAQGTIGLAALTVVAQAVFRLANQLFASTHTESWLEHGAASVPAVRELEAATRPPLVHAPRSPNGRPRSEVRFEGVSFAYDRREPVFDGLDLPIPAGRSLAVVGANGAGKTTLIKLLCRLYEPAAGRITADGTDIREFAPADWQRRIAVIFQDFVHFDLAVSDNVGFGSIGLAHDRAALQRAAERAGADALIAGLPHGWDTVLSPRYAGGTELSGGQWQRIALARALMAVEGGAGILVLDEPTAALDVRAEAELFDRFIEITRGLTTIVISHRFGTVRRADRICVLDRGRVTEMGSHDELMTADGLYAHLFGLQAARFSGAAQA